MSDMCQNIIVIGEMSDTQIELYLYRAMPGMEDWPHLNRHVSDMQTMASSPCIRSHVGYKQQSAGP